MSFDDPLARAGAFLASRPWQGQGQGQALAFSM